MVKPARLAHVVLRVRDLEQSERFYTNLLDLQVTSRIGTKMVFMSASEDASHELALLSIGPEAPGPDPSHVGMYHFAWQMKSLEDLRHIYKVIRDSGLEIGGIGDHGISLGVYLFDPDGNEIEVFFELPKEDWPDDNIFTGSFPGGIKNLEHDG